MCDLEDLAGTKANLVILAGELSADPVWRDESDPAELSFRMKCVSESTTGAELIECVATRSPLARKLEKYAKGKRLLVQGVLRTRYWQSSGAIRSRTFVEVDQVKVEPK